MSSGTLGAILRRLLLVAEQESADQSDRHLLECFVTKKDEAAFAALMERHAQLVFGVCRSVLAQEQDAEDAFQATFLVLARMASSIRKRDSLANWLHGVALRTALKARQAMNTRRRKEPQASIRTLEQPVSEAAFRELQAILHEEVGRLPEKYRTPFVLCCLEGKSRVEVAQELGWKEGTVASRVAQARKLLESRLLQRGVALPAALTAAALAPAEASAAVLTALSSVVTRGAAAFAAGNVAESVSAGVATLAEGVIQAMVVTKFKLVTGMVLTLALMMCGGGLLAYTALQTQEPDPATVAPPKDTAEEKPDPPLPGAGDGLEAPLPPGAIVRLGTTRFRTGTVVGSLKLSRDGKKLVSGGRSSGGGVFVWDAATGKRILWRPLGEEGELSRDGQRFFVIETLSPPPPKAKAKLPEDTVEVVGASQQPEVKNVLNIYQLSTGKLLQQIDGSGYLHRFTVAPDERTLALEYAIRNVNVVPGDLTADWYFKTRLELYDLKTGRVTHKLGELPQTYAGNGLVRFSADGKTLFAVSCSKENENRDESTVRRFDVATGTLKSKTAIKGTGYGMPPGCHTPLNAADKTLIASRSKLWDLDKERLHWALKGKDLEAILAFMPDGHTAIAWAVKEKWLDAKDPSSMSKLVHWDLEADREIRRIPGISFGAISPDGKTCYGANWPYNRWLRYELASGKEIVSVDAPTASAETVAFSPDGKYLATYYGLWDRATGKLLHPMPPAIIGGGPFFFSPDSKFLVYGAGGIASLFMVDTCTWKPIKRDFEPALPLVNNFSLGMESSTCRISPDGKVLATRNALWDWESGKVLGKLQDKTAEEIFGQVGPIAFSPDSKQLVCVAALPAKTHVQIWNIADRKLISDKVMTDWPKELRKNVQLIADGKLLAAGWLPDRGPWRGMLRFPEEQDKPIPADWPATMPPMPDAVVGVWDPATGKQKYRFQYPQNENMSDIPALFSPDGKLVVTANYHDEVVYFRDPASGKEVGRFRCGVKGVSSMAFSPDSQVLAVSAKDTTVQLVDVRKVVKKP